MAKKKEPELPSLKGIPLRDLQIDDIWRAKAKTRMKELGLNQYMLAEYVGCAQGNVSQLMSTKRGQTRSLHAERISVALGIEMTLLARAELAVVALIESNPDLAGAAVSSWEMTAQAIAKKSQ